ncbi:hypothetical protein AURDEDRAFT_165694, partial [Auricularia subglabra TFB-10046 SS5]
LDFCPPRGPLAEPVPGVAIPRTLLAEDERRDECAPPVPAPGLDPAAAAPELSTSRTGGLAPARRFTASLAGLADEQGAHARPEHATRAPAPRTPPRGPLAEPGPSVAISRTLLAEDERRDERTSRDDVLGAGAVHFCAPSDSFGILLADARGHAGKFTLMNDSAGGAPANQWHVHVGDANAAAADMPPSPIIVRLGSNSTLMEDPTRRAADAEHIPAPAPATASDDSVSNDQRQQEYPHFENPGIPHGPRNDDDVDHTEGERAIEVTNNFTEEAQYQARVHPEEPSHLLTAVDARKPHEKIVYICKYTSQLPDWNDYQRDWLFHAPRANSQMHPLQPQPHPARAHRSPSNASNGHPLAVLGAAPASTPSTPLSPLSGLSAAVLSWTPPVATLSPSSPPYRATTLTGSDAEREKTPALWPNDQGARTNALPASTMDSIHSKKRVISSVRHALYPLGGVGARRHAPRACTLQPIFRSSPFQTRAADASMTPGYPPLALRLRMHAA